MLARLLLVGGIVAAAALAFVIVLRWPFEASGSSPVSELSQETMCEIDLGPERCPAKPDLVPGRPRIFFDRHDKAHLDIERCLRRAEEFALACKPKGPVAARFYKGRELVRATSFKP